MWIKVVCRDAACPGLRPSLCVSPCRRLAQSAPSTRAGGRDLPGSCARKWCSLRVVNSTLPTSQGTQNVGPVEFTTLRYCATAPARREFSGRRW